MKKRPYATRRTQRWLKSEIREFNRKEVETIEESGCQVLGVMGKSRSQNFAYTFGLFDNAGLPEMIAVGLEHKTAFGLLLEAADREPKGVDLSHGKHRGLLGADVECVFRPVAPKWIKHLMLGATWFYGESKFTALQVT